MFEDTTLHIRKEFIQSCLSVRYGQWIGALIGLVLGLWLAFTVDGPARWYLIFIAIMGPTNCLVDYLIQRALYKQNGFNRETAMLMCTEMSYKEDIGDESPTDWPEDF